MRIATQLALVLLLGCGAAASTPAIQELEIEPAEGVRAGGVLTLTVSFVDDDEDLPGGNAEIALRLETEPVGEVFEVPLGGDPSRRGKITFSVTMPGGAIPGTYEIAVTAIDRSGRRSAPLTGTFDVIP